MKKSLCGVAIALLAVAIGASAAYANPRLWTDSSETVPLRSVKAKPVNQPDALEFVNEGPVAFQLFIGGAIKSVTCTEIEMGTTVMANNEVGKAPLETRLALPFGIAEGDDCTHINSAGIPENVPVLFDTNANGQGLAQFEVTGPSFEATIEKLKFSLEIEKAWCTITIQGAKGALSNVTSGFVEDAPPNLNLTVGATGTSTCPKLKGNSELKGRFYLETMSTATDTAFIGP